MSIAVGSLILSVLSLCVAAASTWWTVFRHGRLAMTRPSVVFFGFDAVPRTTAKVFLRCLLYSTAVRGQVIEAMYAKVQRAGSEQVFGFWGYGETTKLSAGSGLFVGQTGIALNHHFVLSVHEQPYEFLAGDYVVEVFARQVGQRRPRRLGHVQLTVTEANAEALKLHQGVLFELIPENGTYAGHTSSRPAVRYGAED